jgi:hypothetical protein
VADIINDAVVHSLRALIEKYPGAFDGPGESQTERQRHCDESHAGKTEYKHPGNGYLKIRHDILLRIGSFA